MFEEDFMVSLLAIGNLKCLETLNLMSNELEDIPNGISGCIKLKTLQLDLNRLALINQGILRLPLLQDLSVTRNKLECLPLGMLRLSFLTLHVPSHIRAFMFTRKISFHFLSTNASTYDMQTRLLNMMILPYITLKTFHNFYIG